jgi:UDP-N-acetylglucosamine 2-epimerase (non-hydrolysing)
MRPECTDRYIQRRMPHVLTVFGTRPEAVKLAPVVLELQRRAGSALVSHVCVTAQHRDMLDQVLRVFGIVPDVDLNVMADNQSPTQVASAVLARLEPILDELRPDWVVVQGDTTTVALAALAAFYARVRVAHVEAGLRTDDKWQPFPEEMNRRIAGAIADLHLAPTVRARDNLLREGVPGNRILVTGNPGIDALHWVTAQPTPSDVRAQFASWGLDEAPESPRLVLVTAHRRENFGAGIERICLALRDLARRYRGSVRIVYPVHRNPHVWEPVHRLLGQERWVTLVPPLDYLPNLHLMRRATLVLTDSGGVQEEAPGLGVPALVLRDVTERPEGVEAGVLRLVGTDRARIVAEATQLLDDPRAYRAMARAVNPFGDGHAAERIVSALLDEPVDELDVAGRILTA